MRRISSLLFSLENLNDIRQVMLEMNDNKVITIGQAYRGNLVVLNIQKHLKRYYQQQIAKGGLKIDSKMAQSLVMKSILALRKEQVPIKSIIKERNVKGLYHDKKTDKFGIAPSKALNFIEKFFEVEDKNRNKPDKRYLILKNIVYKNYRFLDGKCKRTIIAEREDDFEQPIFMLDETKYDGMSGENISVREANEEEEDENDDFPPRHVKSKKD